MYTGQRNTDLQIFPQLNILKEKTMCTELSVLKVAPMKLNALVKDIMRRTDQTDPEKAVQLVNSGEWVIKKVVHNWREQDGTIYFSVTSDGMTGPHWIRRLTNKGFWVDDEGAQGALCSKGFRPTVGVLTKIAVLSGTFKKDNLKMRDVYNMQDVYLEAKRRKLKKPNAEVACLIREMFIDEEIKAMGLNSIITVHEPINGLPLLLEARRHGNVDKLGVICTKPHNEDRFHSNGFAFAVSQVRT